MAKHYDNGFNSIAVEKFGNSLLGGHLFKILTIRRILEISKEHSCGFQLTQTKN